MSKFDQMILEMETKKLLREMMYSCAKDMLAVGIPVQIDCIIGIDILSLKGTRACCYCKKVDAKDTFVIGVHKKLLKYIDDEEVIKNVKNSMYHELLHTCKNSQDHGKEWMKWSKICDEKLHTHTRRHLEEKIYYQPNTKHIVYTCPNCGNEYWAVKKIEDTSCELCGSNMI